MRKIILLSFVFILSMITIAAYPTMAMVHHETVTMVSDQVGQSPPEIVPRNNLFDIVAMNWFMTGVAMLVLLAMFMSTAFNLLYLSSNSRKVIGGGLSQTYSKPFNH